MSRAPRRACVIAIVGLASACTGAAGTASRARATFGGLYTCPKDAIAVTVRRDIAAHTFLAPSQPPGEVAQDPSRSALWETQRRQAEAQADQYEVYDVQGCGHRDYYACRNDASTDFEPVCLPSVLFAAQWAVPPDPRRGGQVSIPPPARDGSP
jgi:hypothetical protein